MRIVLACSLALAVLAPLKAKDYRADFESYERPKELTWQFGPLVQDVTPSAARIVWGAFQGEAGRAEVFEAGGDKKKVGEFAAVRQDPEKAEDHWTRTFYEDAMIFEAQITGLQPDTVYAYCAKAAKGEKEVQSKTFSFRTAPEPGRRKPFTFLLYGDTREKNRVTWHYEVAAAALKQAGENLPRFVVVTGDNANDSEMFKGWLYEFLKPGEELYAQVPPYLAVGNHDVHPIDKDKKSEKITPGLQRAIFTPPHGETDHFTMRWDNVKLIVIDTQLRDLTPGAEQRKWLAEQCVREEGVDWLVVAGHHPAISTNVRPGSRGVETCTDLFAEHAVDLYLCGHNHHYERLEENGVTYVVSGGGGAQLYGFNDPKESSKVRVRAHHFCLFNVDGRKLSVDVRDLEGKQIDTFALERPEDPKGKAKKVGEGRK